MGRSLKPSTDPQPELAQTHRQAAAADRDLMQRLRDQDERALETLYDQYGGLIFALALRITGDRGLAQEILQDTFLRCWNGAAQFDHARGHVAAWLMGIARNRAIDVLRSRQHQMQLRQEALSDPTHGGEGDPVVVQPAQHDPSDALLLRHTVREALADLTETQRQVIEMAYYGGLTQTEIADRLSTPLGTIKTRMRDGMLKMRGALRSLIDLEGGRDE